MGHVSRFGAFEFAFVCYNPYEFLQQTPKAGSHGDVSREPKVPKPRHAWRSADSPITDVNHSTVGKGIIDHDQMSVTSGAQSHLTHRAEELSSEW